MFVKAAWSEPARGYGAAPRMCSALHPRIMNLLLISFSLGTQVEAYLVQQTALEVVLIRGKVHYNEL